MTINRAEINKLATEEVYRHLYEKGLISENFLRKKLAPAALAAVLAGSSPAAAEPQASDLPVAAATQDDMSNFYFSDYDVKIEDMIDAGQRLPDDFDADNIMNPDILDKVIKYKYTQDVRDALDSGVVLAPNIDMDYIMDPEVKERLMKLQAGEAPKIDIAKAIASRIGKGRGKMPSKTQLGTKPLWPQIDPAAMHENWRRFIKEEQNENYDS